MDGEQTESFTSMGQALDAAVAKRETGESQQTVSDGENGGQSTHSTPPAGTSSTTAGRAGTSNPSNGDTSAKGTETKTANRGFENQRGDNFRNMSRRIRQRENNSRVNSRIQQLREQQQELLRTGDEQALILAHQKGSEIENLMAMQQDAAYSEWSQRACECFTDPEVFLDQSERYGEYVNANEPELVSYIDRPYGMFLYRSWMDQMDNGDFRSRWVGMTAFEKGAVLNKIYSQILGFANGKGQQPQGVPNGQQATQQGIPQGNPQGAPNGSPNGGVQNQKQPPATPDIPIPGSGRESNMIPAPNNFGEAFQNALARRGLSSL